MAARSSTSSLANTSACDWSWMAIAAGLAQLPLARGAEGLFLAEGLRPGNYQVEIFFDGASATLPAAPWDIAFQISSDVYEGETRLQMQVQALRKAEPAA